MKKFLFSFLAIVALCLPISAQSAIQTFGDAIESQAFPLGYDFTSQSVTRIYRDGVQFRDFSIAEISVVSTNAATLLVTYKIIIPGLSKGVYNFTATIVNGATESLPSNVCTITVRPSAPGQLRKL